MMINLTLYVSAVQSQSSNRFNWMGRYKTFAELADT